MHTFVKRNPTAPPGFFACEAAGLQWLSVANGARCVQVRAHDETSLTLERLETTTPTAEAARAFGAALARTHSAGATAWGAPPDDWAGPGFFGPLQRPLPMSYTTHDGWSSFYASERLEPMADLATSTLNAAAQHDIATVVTRCRARDFDDDDTPARLHGDLWSGNLMWTADGVVLIDPAAHGGHRETDIAMLHLFGCPHLDAVVEGYHNVHPLLPGWRDRTALHQLYPLLAHAVLFGSRYAHQAHAAAREVLALH